MELGAKVIITGGLGFIFSHVTEYLVKKGYSVLVIDNLSAGSHPELIHGTGFQFIKGDVHHKEVIDTIVNFDPHYIIHAAAYSDVDGSIATPRDIIKANCDATLNVFEAARQCTSLKKLVYVSTDEVYGECDHKKREDEILFPKNPYSFSKAHGSLLRLAYDNSYPELKDKTAETRFCNVFGPRQDERKILPQIKRAVIDGTTVPVHNGGGGYREYIYVYNIPPIVETIMLKGDRVYNVTLNDGFTVNELIEIAKEVTEKDIKTTVSNRPGMDTRYQMDPLRAFKLGWRPEWDFYTAIKHYLC